ncbi:hypothetical protein N2152v2_003040 [Parachlorella kessleri]
MWQLQRLRPRSFSPAAGNWQAVTVLVCLVALGNTGASSSGDVDTVPCKELPEFAGIPSLPTIYGDCRPSKASSGEISVASIPTTLSGSERWITLWKPDGGSSSSSSLPDPEGAANLTLTACLEGEAADSGRFNASCTHMYSASVSGFTAAFTRQQLVHFLAAYAPLIESVSVDSNVKAFTEESTAASGGSSVTKWGLDRIDQPNLPLDNEYYYYNLGTGVHAYIIDTGIRTTHAEFKYSDGRAGSRADEVYTTQASSKAGEDCEGHGTHVAGTVGGLTYGVAKNVTLHAVRILDCSGDGTVSDVIAALDWLVRNAKYPAVATMSLGGDIQPALDAAVESATKAGIHVVVAAGNDDSDACQVSPARTPTALTVGATDEQDKRLWVAKGVGSNWGDCVDLLAPGRDILSSSNEADTATELRTGTSQAVPFAAGVVALILENRTDTTPANMITLLESNAASVTYQPDPFSTIASGQFPLQVSSSSTDPTFDNLQANVSVADTKGDVLSYPKVIASLPFTDTDSTSDYQNDYVLACSSSTFSTSAGAASKDVAYYFQPQQACTVTFSLCGSSKLSSSFDTRLFVLQNVDDGGSLDLLACDDDGCGTSKLSKTTVKLAAGQGYGIIVDGNGSQEGLYRLTVTAAEGAVPGGIPPSSLLSSKTRVVGTVNGTTTNSTVANMVSIPGTDLYWVVGDWSACDLDCRQTRVVACYSAAANGQGTQAAALESACTDAGATKPDITRACDSTDCVVTTDSVLKRNLPLIVGLGSGVLVAVALAALLLCYCKHRQSMQATKAQQPGVPEHQQFVVGSEATVTVRSGGSFRRQSSTPRSSGRHLNLGKGQQSMGRAGHGATPHVFDLPSAQHITVHAADYVLPSPVQQQQRDTQQPLAPIPLPLPQHVVDVSGSPSHGGLLRQRSPRKSSSHNSPEVDLTFT